MSTSRIARRYSKALVGLCEKDRSYALVAKDLESFAKMLLQYPTVMDALSSPLMDLGAREKVLKDLGRALGLRPMTGNFISFLADQQRLGEIHGIVEDFQRRLDAIAGRVRASVTSATTLSPLELQRIKASLEKASGKKVVLETSVDPTILGGVVTKVGNLVLDGSVKSALNQMREQLHQAVQ